MVPSFVRRRAALITLSGFLVACGGDADAPDPPRGDLSGPDVTIEPAVEELYTLGALDGDDWETFANLSHVAFDRDGNLYLFDQDARRISVVDPGGQHLRTFGQEGGGPGEFQQPWGFAVFRDGRLAVMDVGQRAVQMFSPGGEHLGDVPFDPTIGLPGQQMMPVGDDALVSTGGLTISSGGAGRTSVRMGRGGAGSARPIDYFSLADTSKAVLYEAWNPPPPEGDPETVSSDGGGNRRFRISMDPLRAFEPGLAFAPLTDGRVAVVDSIGYRVKFIGPDGTVESVLERPVSPIEVTDAIREAERASRLRAVAENTPRMVMIGGSGGGPDPDAIRGMMEERIRSMQFAPQIPVIANMSVDWEDRLWIERAAEPGQEGPTDIVGSDGYYFGTVPATGIRIPDAFGPDGLMAYIETDELDVQRVRVVRLSGSEVIDATD